LLKNYQTNKRALEFTETRLMSH